MTHYRHLSGTSHEGTVVLDIGGDIGALIVFAPYFLLGSEIEIRPRSHVWNGQHTAVRERRMGNDIRCAGVFGALTEGSYELRIRSSEDATVQSVDVLGGRVTQIEWPA